MDGVFPFFRCFTLPLHYMYFMGTLQITCSIVSEPKWCILKCFCLKESDLKNLIQIIRQMLNIGSNNLPS